MTSLTQAMQIPILKLYKYHSLVQCQIVIRLLIEKKFIMELKLKKYI